MEDNPPPPKSIFDTASELSRARKQKTQGAATQKNEGEKQEMTVKEMVRKGEKLHEELSSKVDTVFTVHKILPSKYRHYLSQQQNFSSKDWQALENQRKKNEELLIELGRKIGRTTPPKRLKEEKEPTPKVEEPEKKNLPKKGKPITKRHWIGM